MAVYAPNSRGQRSCFRSLGERSPLKRSGGTPGVHRLERDDVGNLVAFIAGHSFIGSGTISLGGNRLLVVDGILVNVQKP